MVGKPSVQLSAGFDSGSPTADGCGFVTTQLQLLVYGVLS